MLVYSIYVLSAVMAVFSQVYVQLLGVCILCLWVHL